MAEHICDSPLLLAFNDNKCEECEWDEYFSSSEIGTCQGCGAYGEYKTMHCKLSDNVLQECGEFL